MTLTTAPDDAKKRIGCCLMEQNEEATWRAYFLAKFVLWSTRGSSYEIGVSTIRVSVSVGSARNIYADKPNVRNSQDALVGIFVHSNVS